MPKLPFFRRAGACSSRHSRRKTLTRFFFEIAGAKKKLQKKKRRKKLSPSAECDKGSAPLTAQPLKRLAKLLVVSPKLPTSTTHLRESARFPRASMFARATRRKPCGEIKLKILPKQAIKNPADISNHPRRIVFFYNPSVSFADSSLSTREPVQGTRVRISISDKARFFVLRDYF